MGAQETTDTMAESEWDRLAATGTIGQLNPYSILYDFDRWWAWEHLVHFHRILPSILKSMHEDGNIPILSVSVM